MQTIRKPLYIKGTTMMHTVKNTPSMKPTILPHQSILAPATRNAKCSAQITQAKRLQARLFDVCFQRRIDPRDLASLAASWCRVTDALRVLRGIPDPGQLRPEMDPSKLVKALKRARSRQIVDIGGYLKAGDFEEPAAAPETIETPGETLDRVTTEETKESL